MNREDLPLRINPDGWYDRPSTNSNLSSYVNTSVKTLDIQNSGAADFDNTHKDSNGGQQSTQIAVLPLPLASEAVNVERSLDESSQTSLSAKETDKVGSNLSFEQGLLKKVRFIDDLLLIR